MLIGVTVNFDFDWYLLLEISCLKRIGHSLYHTFKGHLTYAPKYYCAKPKRNPKKKEKKKERKKRVKGNKHQTKQPPEKANQIPKLPPTHYSEVTFLQYTPFRPLDRPPKTHFGSKKLTLQLPKTNIPK